MNYPFKADLYTISSSNTPLYSTGWTYSYTVHSSLQENCPVIAPWVKPELDMSSPSNKQNNVLTEQPQSFLIGQIVWDAFNFILLFTGADTQR